MPADQIEHATFPIKLALEEALVNHAKHGHGFNPDKEVTVAVQLLGDRVVIESTDEGPGFDPDDLPDPTDVEYIDRPCGRGVFLMGEYAEKTGGSIEFLERGNRVRMTFLLSGVPAGKRT